MKKWEVVLYHTLSGEICIKEVFSGAFNTALHKATVSKCIEQNDSKWSGSYNCVKEIN
jgi:hypothetical protein